MKSKLFLAVFLLSIPIITFSSLLYLVLKHPSAESSHSIFEPAAQYKLRCAKCHGMDANGLSAPSLIDSIWRFGDGSVESIEEILTNGISGTSMPAWKYKLTPEDIRSLAEYVHSLSK